MPMHGLDTLFMKQKGRLQVAKINNIWAREILDSRGIPTIETVCQLDNDYTCVASDPAGTSTGTHEALELRDKADPRYLGKGVQTAVNNVNNILTPLVKGMDPQNQEEIDKKLIDADETENKSRYGANAILSISKVVTKAGAEASGKPLYGWINELSKKHGLNPKLKVPTP